MILDRDDAGRPCRLTFDRPTVDGAAVLALRVSGEVDVSGATALHDAVRDGLEELARQEREEPVVRSAALLVDLRSVPFLAAAGLNSLIEAARDAPRRREPVRLVVDHNSAVVRPSHLVGLDDVFGLYDDLDDAVSGLPRAASPGPRS